MKTYILYEAAALQSPTRGNLISSLWLFLRYMGAMQRTGRGRWEPKHTPAIQYCWGRDQMMLTLTGGVPPK